MNLLLDTHSFLWFILNDNALSHVARRLIANPANKVQISPASYCEIAIKIALGKFKLNQPYRSFLENQIVQNIFTIVPVEIGHTDLLTSLPMHHRDQFDRLLICQALAEKIAIISADSQFDAYGVQRLW